jgi:hypothetical protein
MYLFKILASISKISEESEHYSFLMFYASTQDVNSYLCIKSIILHFAARIVILMPEALAEGIKTIRAAKCNLCS